MELLLFWKDHYMDAWDAAKVASLDANMKAKYDRRYRRGDIVEVREDGYFSEGHFDKESFCVVKVPGMAYDADKMGQLFDRDPAADTKSVKAKMIRRRKWFADKTKMPANILNKIESQGNVVTVTEAQVNNFLERNK